jgi:hypothetical protein
MNKLIKKLPEALDPLFSAVADLKSANKDDIIACTVLCTRAKIYTLGMRVIKMLKKKQYNDINVIINRIIKLISIHRNQLYKLTKKTAVCLTNFVFLKDLKTLFLGIRVCFCSTTT